MPNRYGIILPGSKDFPGGNYEEFADIRERLRERGVVWFERVIGNSTVFWFYESEIAKLPICERTRINEPSKIPQFIPVDDDLSGHGVGKMSKFLEHHNGRDMECPQ